jgi:hypothetical protein
MKTNTFNPSQISHQPKLGTSAYWSVCAFASAINSDRTPEGTVRVRGEQDS